MGRLLVPALPDKKRVAEYDYEDGYPDDVCSCGYEYQEHVTVPGYTFLVRLCDGTLIEMYKT